MAITHPDTVGSTTNPPSASTLVKQSGGTFVIKMWGCDGTWKPESVEKTTGDGDANVVYEHNEMQEGYYRVTGACVSGAEIGIEQLKTSNNPGTFKFIRQSGSDAGTTQTVTAMVVSLRYSWRRGRVYIPLTLDLLVTSTTPSSVEGTT